MIPAAYKEDIIQSGINFMRSITEAYGSDEGLRLRDTIASTLDPDVKGEIFFAMLTGDHCGAVVGSIGQPRSCREEADKWEAYEKAGMWRWDYNKGKSYAMD